MSQQTIFVSGATGTVGGAVAHNLLKANIAVHALARDPESPAAKALAELGASLTKGGYDDDDALKEAMKNVSGAFLNLTPDFIDHTWELRTAKRIMAAAKEAGAVHFIYSSGFAVQAPEKLEHCDRDSFVSMVLHSKQSIEKAVREAGFEYWTVLRPGSFSSNYLLPQAAPFPDLINKGRFANAFKPTSKIPTLDPYDIGRFALAAYRDPTRFSRQEIPLSSEMLTVDEIMAKLSKASGKDIRAVFLTEEEIDSQKAGNPFIAGQLAARDMDQFADEENTRSWGITMTTFDEFLERERERVMQTYAQLA
ncbi:NmrA-like family domain-containing protein 1 [Colletotrichum sp. SAR 10_86]|nr:NmrA-like family domain-containing protein 1 [Colletotrichum sp. SAR 10_86]KAJ5000081.1 NmrA-like family domain-containing protein 1 [Colletotrichum sp. SAR 10_66]